MNKEYVFVGTAQLKTRDYINQLEKENKELKDKPIINSIHLSKGFCKIYLDDEDIEVLIKMYENKIEEINKKIDKFKLSKIID